MSLSQHGAIFVHILLGWFGSGVALAVDITALERNKSAYHCANKSAIAYL
jgi:hypothetical protein